MTIANDNLTEKPFSRLVTRFFARGRIILSVAAWSIVLRPDGSLVFERVVKKAFFIFMPKLLELFAGSRSVGHVAERLGFDVFSVDVQPFDRVDLVKDIQDISRRDIPFTPDVIWASPPCTTYSLAAISHHRRGIIPVSKDAEIADRLLQKTIDIFGWFLNAQFFMENPVGMMRKMPQVKSIDRRSVTYCSYGDTRMKPTDIWTNNAKSLFQKGWQPRPRCRNGNRKCHHEPAPRGAKTGTQGLKNAYERGKVPEALIEEILTTFLEDKNYVSRNIRE